MSNENKEIINEVIPAEEFEWVGQDIKGMEQIGRPSISYWKDAIGRLFKSKVAIVLIVILGIITIGAIIVPMLSPFGYQDMCPGELNKGFLYHSGEHLHIFGTDTLGRDIFTRVWYGGRISLTIAVTAVAINCVVGIVYGGIAGYFGGMLDNVMMRFVEILNGIPYLLIIILLSMVMPKGIITIIVAYSAVGWIGMSRLVRGQIISLKEQEFVIAAKTMGASATRIISKHLIPNLLSIIIINLTLSIPNAIFTEAWLSYIGLGVPVPQASWGTLASDASNVFRYFPYQLIVPAIFISITMLSFNLLGDKLRDAFDPKLRR